MSQPVPEALGIIAGKGVYPLLLAESAKKQGVKRVFVIAFKRETDCRIERLADEVTWVHLGQLAPVIEAFRKSGVAKAVMAGQITPTHLFNIRMDRAMLDLLKKLPVRNAETIFGAVGERLKAVGVELQPAHLFMESAMCPAGLLSKRAPTDAERADIDLGLQVAKLTSSIDIGQTVVIKQGTILAVEAFEGTDAAILRAGKLGGPGAVVVKVAKQGHDMRFDIPVVGMHTMKVLKKVRAAVLAVEAGRAIVLEREEVAAEADRLGMSLLAVEFERPSA
ncbi:MAG: UDP-2,3-diacylglucosamine diphosphatase LpxI [Kiritimatiellae bacterium]|nr:UDP-2,3-diacylglucosamine diphosphatase LpxI [Kiritimatiellia bacterium]